MTPTDPGAEFTRRLQLFVQHVASVRNEAVHRPAASGVLAPDFSDLRKRLDGEMVAGVPPEVFRKYMSELAKLDAAHLNENRAGGSVAKIVVTTGTRQRQAQAAPGASDGPLSNTPQIAPAWLQDVPFFVPRAWRGRLLEEIYGDYMEMAGRGRGRLFVWSAVLSQLLLLGASGAWGLLRDLIPGRRS